MGLHITCDRMGTYICGLPHPTPIETSNSTFISMYQHINENSCMKCCKIIEEMLKNGKAIKDEYGRITILAEK